MQSCTASSQRRARRAPIRTFSEADLLSDPKGSNGDRYVRVLDWHDKSVSENGTLRRLTEVSFVAGKANSNDVVGKLLLEKLQGLCTESNVKSFPGRKQPEPAVKHPDAYAELEVKVEKLEANVEQLEAKIEKLEVRIETLQEAEKPPRYHSPCFAEK